MTALRLPTSRSDVDGILKRQMRRATIEPIPWGVALKMAVLVAAITAAVLTIEAEILDRYPVPGLMALLEAVGG